MLPMPGSGHERHFRDVRRTSALPPILAVTAVIPDRQLGAISRHSQARTQILLSMFVMI